MWNRPLPKRLGKQMTMDQLRDACELDNSPNLCAGEVAALTLRQGSFAKPQKFYTKNSLT
jgi:hypothetical protein